MEKRIERWLIVIAALLLLNMLKDVKPYQIHSADAKGLFGYRLNCYTGSIERFSLLSVPDLRTQTAEERLQQLIDEAPPAPVDTVR